jgi:hypothetical protein
MTRWVIAVVLTAGFALGNLFWNATIDTPDQETGIVELQGAPELAQERTTDSGVVGLGIRHVETGGSKSLVPVDSSATSSRSEPTSSGSFGEKSPVTALAQFGPGGPGGRQPGGANQPGAGNGNQFSGAGSPFGGQGQGTGGVCIATKIQLEPNATTGLSDRRDKAVFERPVQGRFFSD